MKVKSVTQTRSRVTFLVAEALLIVLSILLAFAIDAAWEERQEAERRIELLQALRADLVATAADLDTVIAQGQALVLRTGGYLRAVRSGQDIGVDSLTFLFEGVAGVSFFEQYRPGLLNSFAVLSLLGLWLISTSRRGSISSI